MARSVKPAMLSDRGYGRGRTFVAAYLFAIAGGLVLLGGCRKGQDAAPTVKTQPAPEPVTTPAAHKSSDEPTDEPTGAAMALGTQGAVSSAEANASAVGLHVLEQGGNAVDAAVAVGFALAVTHPSAGNLGGGGFMVVRWADDGRTAAIDYRERAPGAASKDMYLGEDGEPTNDRLLGPKAAGIPGTVAGLALAHQRFGTRPWKDLVMPAVALARDGVALDRFHAEDLAHGSKQMRLAGYDASAAYYRQPDGREYAEGDTWAQPELAQTLQVIAQQGPEAFYTGPLAVALAEGVAQAGGIWAVEDLAQYRAQSREPIVFPYRDHEIITMPPPSAGGVVLRQLLSASESLDLKSHPWRSASEIHLFVEAMRRTYADRNMLLGDPDFVTLPIDRLLNTTYVATRMADIDPNRATPSASVGAGLPARPESEETTHFSVVDGQGNAVSNTYTLNLGFGAKFVVPGTGVLLNNEMDDFSVKPGSANVFGLVQGEPNKIEPGKRMLSSMTPTIIVKDGKLRAVVGTPGGPTITTTVATLVRALIDYEMRLDGAIESVRVHHQWKPDQIWTEERLDPEVEAALVAKGHSIRKRSGIGHANCIEVDPKTRELRAVADVQRDGGAAVAY